MREYFIRITDKTRIEEIATKYGISIEKMLRDNNIRSKEDIFVGRRLYINIPDGIKHFVKPFETIRSIASLYNTSIEKIRSNNGGILEVFVGQIIYIPKN